MENPLLTPSPLPFGAPQFDKIRIEHYLPAFKEAVAEAKAEIDAIADNPDPPTFENTVEAMEYSGRTLERVAGIFYNINEADTNDQMQALAEEISPMMTEFSMYISLDEKLFARVRAVSRSEESKALETDSKKLLEKTYKSFVRGGANLSAEDKALFAKWSEELDLLSLQFQRNVLASSNAFVLNLTEEEDLAGLPPYLKEAGAIAARQRGLEGWAFTLDAPIYRPFMRFSARRDLRRKMYMAYNTRAVGGSTDNVGIVGRIVDLRLKIANILGYRSYADYALEERMAGSSRKVLDFLDGLMEVSLPFAREEVARVREYALAHGFGAESIQGGGDTADKKEDGGPETTSKTEDGGMETTGKTEDGEMETTAKMGDGGKKTTSKTEDDGPEGRMMPWDFDFWAERYKEANFSVNEEALKPYFRLEICIDAVFDLAHRLYGISFEPRNDIPVYHPDVKVYDVKDADGSHLALFYADFFPRESKRGGAWMTEFRGQSIRDGVEERPLISIVTNFTKPTEEAPSLLTHDELTTFLHEFGHALHGILAKGKYGSLSGTNVTRDFVELPSQIMENWAFEPQWLCLFARHYLTGEVLPAETIGKIVSAKNYLSGYYQVRQLRFGILDMAFHTLEAAPAGEGDPAGTNEPADMGDKVEVAGSVEVGNSGGMDTTVGENSPSGAAGIDPLKIEEETLRSSSLLPEVSGCAIAPSFGHIFSGGYAAGYYSYKWAEVLEADAFSLFRERGIFDRATAESFRMNILEKGGSEDAAALYRRFRGRDPQPAALMEKLGLFVNP